MKLTEEQIRNKIIYVKTRRKGSCWEWAFCRNRYGIFRVLGETLAHRVSYRVFIGEIPKGMNVLHKCDNTVCVNPKHLFLGTQLDNVRDMIEKGRGNWAKGLLNARYTHPETSPRGVKHGRAKLNDEIVKNLRNMFRSGQKMNISQLSRQYGVARPVIRNAIIGKTWRHVCE